MAAILEAQKTPDVLKFTLPPELEATSPAEARGLQRDEVRLLVSAGEGRSLSHARFVDLPDFLEPGDLLVANDSATLPAALDGWRLDGTPVLLHLSTRIKDDLWIVEPRRVDVLPDEIIDLPDGGMATFVSREPGSERLWLARFSLPTSMQDYLASWGRPITYGYVGERWPLQMYQTVYAREPGSAEMPSAGRAFSRRVLDRLAEKRVGFATLTLHTGVSSPEEHEAPYSEWYLVPKATADAVNAARAAGRRVIAVGTTVVRALETVAGEDGFVRAQSGWTDLLITPEGGVRAVDALLTGLHEPKSSHLKMLQALAGDQHLKRAYDAALQERYLWHEFGDLHLLLPP